MGEQLGDFQPLNGASLVCRDPANDHSCELHILSQNLQPIYL